MRRAEERRSASMMISSSIRWSLAGKRGRLDDEDVLAADVLLDLDEDLHVGEAPHLAPGERYVEIGGNGLRQRTIGVSRDELHADLRLVRYENRGPRRASAARAAGREGLSSVQKPSQYAGGAGERGISGFLAGAVRARQSRAPAGRWGRRRPSSSAPRSAIGSGSRRSRPRSPRRAWRGSPCRGRTSGPPLRP